MKKNKNNKVRRILKKSIVELILIILISFSFLNVFAGTGLIPSSGNTNLTTNQNNISNYTPPENNNTQSNQSTNATSGDTDLLDSAVKTIIGVFDGILGILAWVVMLIPQLILLGISFIVSIVLAQKPGLMTPDLVFFNKIELLNLKLFINPEFSEKAGATLFAQTVSSWFQVFYLISFALLFIILVYIGFRSIVSSLGHNLAETKSMLTNWAMSILILISLSIIVAGSIYFNDFLINILNSMFKTNSIMQKEVGKVWRAMFSFSFVDKIAGTLMFAILLRHSITFFISYIKRLIKIAFLIMIAPLIAASYTMDKMKDKKAQALNYWIKNFTGTVFIQVFHAVIYTMLMTITTVVAIETNNPNILYIILSVMILRYINEAEKEFNKMFGLSDGVGLSEGEKISKMIMGGQMVKYASKASKKIVNYSEKLNEKRTERSREELEERLKNGEAGTQRSQTQIARENLAFTQDENARTQNNNAGTPIDQSSGGQAAGFEIPEGVERAGQQSNNTPEIEAGGPGNVIRTKVDKDTLFSNKSRLGRFANNSLELGGKAAKMYKENIFGVSSAILAGSLDAADGFGDIAATGALGYTVGSGLDKAYKTHGKSKKDHDKQYEKYIPKVKEESENLSKTLKDMGDIIGLNMDNSTEEGRTMIKAFYQSLKDKMDKGITKKEFKKGQEDFIKYLQEQKGMSLAAARVESRRMVDLSKSGKLDVENMTKEEKKFAVVAAEQGMTENFKEMEEKFKLVKGTYKDVQDEVLKGVNESVVVSQRITEELNRLSEQTRNELDDAVKEIEKLQEEYDSLFGDKEKIEATILKGAQLNYSREKIEVLNKQITDEYDQKLKELETKLDSIKVDKKDFLSKYKLESTIDRTEFATVSQRMYAQNSNQQVDKNNALKELNS